MQVGWYTGKRYRDVSESELFQESWGSPIDILTRDEARAC